MHDRGRALTLAEFLLARIAEDDAAFWEAYRAARDAADGVPFVLPPLMMRLPAECEAKRRIVAAAEAEYQRRNRYGGGAVAMTASGRRWIMPSSSLAQPYADHPDFRDEWRL